MKLPHDHVDPDGLQEFSVVFTDRSLNHMSARFQGVMRDVSGMLREVYNGAAVALVPGGGTYAMEAVARQFGQGQVLIVRNGWFSYRWTQIFDAGGFAGEHDGGDGAADRQRGAGALCAAADRRGGGEDPRDAARGGVCAACRNLVRDHPAR